MPKLLPVHVCVFTLRKNRLACAICGAPPVMKEARDAV